MKWKSDPNRVLRLLPIFAGGLGGVLLLVNRLLTIQLTESQARSDALGIIEGAVLILVGLIWQQIQPRSPDVVTLIGEEGFELVPELPTEVKTELAWASHLLLTNTVTRSLVVYYDGKTILRRGILGKESQVTPGTILQKVLDQQKAIYLVNLNLYPGRSRIRLFARKYPRCHMSADRKYGRINFGCKCSSQLHEAR